MARGRKPALTLDEQLEKISEEIEDMESSLKELKSAKKRIKRTDSYEPTVRIR